MTEKLEPLGDRVIVRPIDTEEVSKGGIILPDTAKEKPQDGEIIAIGPGKIKDDGSRIPMEVKVGDKVMFAKYAGTEVKLNDEKLMIMSQSDIMAIKERRSRKKAKEEKQNA
jgi:chaperonin GroES